jgi:hypothetical protein
MDRRKIWLYNLPIILAAGNRVCSPGTKFRQQTTRNLTEFLVKGFVITDEGVKNAGGCENFDEPLARIPEISASKKRF